MHIQSTANRSHMHEYMKPKAKVTQHALLHTQSYTLTHSHTHTLTHSHTHTPTHQREEKYGDGNGGVGHLFKGSLIAGNGQKVRGKMNV